MPARLLLLCVLLGSSWLTVDGDRHAGAAGVLHRRAHGQSWLCGSAWLVAFRSSREARETGRSRVDTER
jgi:hypothetical protein